MRYRRHTQQHVVRSARSPRPMIVPCDKWEGGTFIEGETGEAFIVVWDGRREGPTLCADIARCGNGPDPLLTGKPASRSGYR